MSPIPLTDLIAQPRLRYSICTLVTKPREYAEMVDSFRRGGFTEPDCEFIVADNSHGNRFDGYSGLNAFLSLARSQYIIVCHQDVLLLADGRPVLDARLAELTRIDPTWAVCGNAGRTPAGTLAIRISDPHGEDTRRGPFPGEIVGADENFIVIRKEANLGVPPRLSGFHHYATSLCLSAAALGMKSYAIDFHLRHKSGGNLDTSFRASQDRLTAFVASRKRAVLVGNTVDMAVAAGSPRLMRVANRLLRSRFRRRVLALLSARA